MAKIEVIDFENVWNGQVRKGMENAVIGQGDGDQEPTSPPLPYGIHTDMG